MALIGNCLADEKTLLRVMRLLMSCQETPAIPFVIDKGEGRADYGYAAHKWVVDLFEKLGHAHSPIPDKDRNCIIGLLLGHSPEAISKYAEMYDSVVCGADHRPTDASMLATRGKRIPLAKGDFSRTRTRGTVNS